MTNAERYQEWDTAERDKTYWRIHCPVCGITVESKDFWALMTAVAEHYKVAPGVFDTCANKLAANNDGRVPYDEVTYTIPTIPPHIRMVE